MSFSGQREFLVSVAARKERYTKTGARLAPSGKYPTASKVFSPSGVNVLRRITLRVAESSSTCSVFTTSAWRSDFHSGLTP